MRTRALAMAAGTALALLTAPAQVAPAAQKATPPARKTPPRSQKSAPFGPQSGVQGARNPTDLKTVLYYAADALGMLRGAREDDLILTMQIWATGTMNVGIYVSDMLNAGTASRQAARLAALLGGGKHVTPTPQTSAYDAQIVQAVQAAAGSMPYASVTEIDIYQPSTNGDGSYAPSTDPADEYNGDGSARSKQTFPLSNRSLGIEFH